MKLYWDVAARRLIESLTNPVTIVDLSFYARDYHAIDLYLVQEDGSGGYEAYEIESGLAPVLTAKPAAGLAGAVRCGATFAAGDGEEDEELWTAGITLNDATLLSEVDAAGTTGAAYVLELTLHDESAMRDQDTMQLACTVYPDVHRAGDAIPAVMSPVGPWEYYTAADGRKGLRLRNADGTIVGEFIEP